MLKALHLRCQGQKRDETRGIRNMTKSNQIPPNFYESAERRADAREDALANKDRLAPVPPRLPQEGLESEDRASVTSNPISPTQSHTERLSDDARLSAFMRGLLGAIAGEPDNSGDSSYRCTVNDSSDLMDAA